MAIATTRDGSMAVPSCGELDYHLRVDIPIDISRSLTAQLTSWGQPTSVSNMSDPYQDGTGHHE